MKTASAAGVVAHSLAAAVEQVFISDQAVEADGAARVELAGADADFGTKAVAEAVRETGGAVAVDTCRVDHLHKACRSSVITGQDRIRVVGTVAVDVINSFLDVCDDPDGYDQIQIFRAEIVFCHNIDSFDMGGSFR